ncbi:T9SS type B sorting domain-containing protein, partial [Aureisphaera galaxeae]|uniref:T9SS type B sorting domain-containing protein n=1 Tax=Aureisphaera galaxeae TaxID=1538023 RepID=UPI00234FEEC5
MCDEDGTQDGFTFFDLTVVAPEVYGSLPVDQFDLYYYADFDDADLAGMLALTAPDFSAAIPDPTNYLNAANPDTVYILMVGNANSTSPNNGANGCYDIVPLELIVDPLPEDFGPFEMALCDDELNGSTQDDEVSTFDLTSVEPAVTGGDATLTVTWYLTPADEAADNPIMGPDMFQNTVTPQTLIGRVTTEQDCSITVTLTLTVLPVPTPNPAPAPIELCDDDDDGIVGGFVLTDRDAEIINGEPDVSVLYYESEQEAIDAVAGTEIVSPYTNIDPNTQVVYARVTRDVPPAVLPCFDIVELTLNVIALPDMPDAAFLDPFQSCDTDGSGQAVFDLTQQDAAVLGVQDPADFAPVSYHVLEADAQAGLNAIDPANAFVSTGQTVWVRLESLVTGCVRVTPFELVVGTFPTIGTGGDLYLCDDEVNGSTLDDGVSTFDLSQNTPLIDLGDDTLVVEYYATAADLATGTPIGDPSAYQNIFSPQQEIFVGVTNTEGCSAFNSFFINVEANPAPVEPTAFVACDDDNDGFYTDFILTDKDAEIIGADTDVTVFYYETLLDAQSGDPADALASPYANIVPFSQTIYARVVRDVPPFVNACFAIVAMELRVELLPNPPDPETFLAPMELCDDDTDGFMVFDLTLNSAPVLADQDSPSDFLEVTYYEAAADADAGTNAIPVPDAYTNLSNPQTVWARAENGLTGCYLVTPFDLVVNPLPVLGTGPFEMVECDDTENGSTLDDGVSTFDLTLNNDAITDGDDSYSVSYYLSVADQDAGNAIADPTAHQNIDPVTGLAVNPQDIFVSVFTGPGCEARTDLTLRVLPNPTPSVPVPLEICDGDGGPDDTDPTDGLSVFDLTQKDAEIINGEPDVNILYFEDAALAEAGDPADAVADPTAYQNTVPGGQTIYARVTRDVPPGELPCYVVVELEVVVNPLPDGSAEVPDLVACEFGADGVAVFDITDRDADVLNGQDPALFGVTYYQSLADAQAGSSPILDPTAFPNSSNPQAIYARVTDLSTGCFVASEEDPDTGDVSLSFDLEVKEAAAAMEPALPYEICDNLDGNDGTGAFTLFPDAGNPTELDAEAEALAAEILAGQDPAVYVLTYHETPENAEAGTGALPDIYTNVVNPQVIYARVTNRADPEDEDACFAVVEVVLSVEQLPTVELDEEYRLCVDNGVAIPEESGDPSPPVIDTGLDPSLYIFAWTVNGVLQPNAVDPFIVATEAGSYEVEVTEVESGCSTVAVTTVVTSSPPQEWTVDVTSNAFDGEHSIEATATGDGSYEYQLDDGPFVGAGEIAHTFTGVQAGNHTVTIRDINGCGSVTVEVGVIDYPRLLTPNADGFHDEWNIIGIASGDPTAKIYIFDRFGKLLKQISPMGPGWDGTYNGNPLPSSDYWFRVEYTEDEARKEFTGHFT